MRHLLAATLALGAVASVAIAQSDPPPEVSARQGLMHNFAFSLGTLGGMAKGEIAYDAELAQAAADRLAALSGIPQDGYWTEGTSSQEIEGSRALPAIWENHEDFLSGFSDLHQAAVSMAEVAGSGQEALGPQMQGIGQACGGCHEDYRLSDD